MNLPNKITMCRIVLAVIVLLLLMFPYGAIGVNVPVYQITGNITLKLNYIVAGVLFIIASVTDFGKVMDAIADKVLVNGVLMILAYNGDIPLVIPVIIITRDTVVDSIKMVAGSKGNVVAASIWGKLKTICMMVGLCLVFFSNLPFELIGIRLDYILLIIATVLSIYSGIQYFIVNKQYFLEDK